MSAWTRHAPAASSGIAVLATGWIAWPYTVDDAYVLARYAHRLAEGLGYTMLDGPPTDGVTGPLGLLPGIVAALLGGDPLIASKLTGLAAAALAAILVVDRAGRGGTGQAWIAAALLSPPFLALSAVSGLETGLATLVFTIVACAVWRSGSHGSGPVVGPGPAADWPLALLLLIPWLRPELFPAALALAGLSFRRGRRAGGAASVALLLGLVSVALFRTWMFGSPLPMSALAKPADLSHGLVYVGRAVLVVYGVGVVPLVVAARHREPLVLVLGVHGLALALAGGDWMPGFRLLVPLLPLSALVLSAPLAELTRAHRARGVGAVFACVMVPLVASGLALDSARASGAARSGATSALARWLETQPGPIALVDVGFLVYEAEAPIVDLGGITEPEVAHLEGGHVSKHISEAWLRARAPSVIVLHSSSPPRADEDGRLRWLAGHPVEERVARMPWIIERFRVERMIEHAPGYHYVVLVRR